MKKVKDGLTRNGRKKEERKEERKKERKKERKRCAILNKTKVIEGKFR